MWVLLCLSGISVASVWQTSVVVLDRVVFWTKSTPRIFTIALQIEQFLCVALLLLCYCIISCNALLLPVRLCYFLCFCIISSLHNFCVAMNFLRVCTKKLSVCAIIPFCFVISLLLHNFNVTLLCLCLCIISSLALNYPCCFAISVLCYPWLSLKLWEVRSCHFLNSHTLVVFVAVVPCCCAISVFAASIPCCLVILQLINKMSAMNTHSSLSISLF